MILFAQGAYVPEDRAQVSVLDRGFLYGDSIYETLRAVAGKVLFYEDHAVRLQRSADLLGIDLEPNRIDLLEVLHELLHRNRLENARMRVIVSRGFGGRDQLNGFTPNWVVLIEPFDPLPDGWYEAGIAAVLVSIVRHGTDSLDPEIKSSNLLNNLLARREALRRGASEGVMRSPDGYLAEGAHSNLFWVTREGILRTPARAVGILPGVTRQKVIEIARSLPIPVEEVRARPAEIEDAREILMTSTSWEVVAVTSWDGRIVGDGRRGEIAQTLHRELRRLYDPGEGSG